MTQEPFLRSDSVRNALRRLAAKNELVVYCGAGVTRDRTGLGWDQLVSELFASVSKKRQRDKAFDSKILDALARDGVEPVQKASVVVEAGRRVGQTENQFLSPLLRKILYKDHGWSQGNLLSNVADLAVITAMNGDDISLITTNYDDYIDSEVNEYIQEWFDEGEPVPGLVINVVGDPRKERVIRRPQNGAGSICVHYIHGRVGRSGPPDGEIVFSESSYSASRDRTVGFLSGLLHTATAFLMVGASLNDAPLVEALFRADKTGQWSARSPVKVAVLAPGAGTSSDQAAWLEFSALRGKHLGVEILTADNYAQIAQFVEELTLCRLLGTQGRLNEYVDTASYPVRLQSWWEEWNASSASSNFEQHHADLREALDEVRTYFENLGTSRQGEVLRLEAWLRMNPSVSEDSRHLTQFSNSTGPLLAVPALRRERIELSSNVASVRAFTAGKPLLLGLDALGIEERSTRWKSFFSVPIHVGVELLYEDFSLIGNVPVGVVTLASTLPLRGSEGKASACFSDDLVKLEHYQFLLARLEDVGLLIGTPSTWNP